MKRTRTRTRPLRFVFYTLHLLPGPHATSNMGRLGDLPTMTSDVLLSSAIDCLLTPIADRRRAPTLEGYLQARLVLCLMSGLRDTLRRHMSTTEILATMLMDVHIHCKFGPGKKKFRGPPPTTMVTPPSPTCHRHPGAAQHGHVHGLCKD